jgi:hypothetical protein
VIGNFDALVIVNIVVNYAPVEIILTLFTGQIPPAIALNTGGSIEQFLGLKPRQ